MARDYYDQSKNKNVWTKKKKKNNEETSQKKTSSPSVSSRNANVSYYGGTNYSSPRRTISSGGRSNSGRSTTSSTPQNNTPQPISQRRYQKTGSNYGRERQMRSGGVIPSQERRNEPVTSNRRNMPVTSTSRQRNGVAATSREMMEQRKAEQEAQRKRTSTPADENRAFMQRQKSGILTAEDKRKVQEQTKHRREVLGNTGAAAKKGLYDAGSGYVQGIEDFSEMAASNKNVTKALAMKMGYDPVKDKDHIAELEKNRQRTVEQARAHRLALSEKQQQRQEEFDKRTKGATGFEKALYGASESGAGMLADIGIGAVTGTGQAGALSSMFLRTYGSTRGQAEREGATENEDRLYAALQGLKEVGTELMFPGAGLAKGYVGKAGLPLADKIAANLTKNMGKRAGNLTGAGIRLFGGAVEENAEEGAGWLLDPWIKEMTYGRNVRKRSIQDELKRESDDLRMNIKSEEDAAYAATYLGSEDFMVQTVQQCMDAGLDEQKATEVAAQMRDYLSASLSGDTEAMEDIQDELARTLSGKSLKDYISDLDKDELKETIASTSLLTLTTGLPGTISTTMRGALVRDQLGEEGIKALANSATNFEDAVASARGKVAKETMDEGGNITDTQIMDLVQAQSEQVQKDTGRMEAKEQAADKRIKANGNVSPVLVRNRDGSVQGDEVITREFKKSEAEASEIIKNITSSEESESLSDTEVRDGAQAIAAFETGDFNIKDANELNFSNTVVRTAFEQKTGVDLSQYIVRDRRGDIDIPATNAATKDALFAMAADNLVRTSELETQNWMDNVKGETVAQITQRMGGQGSLALQAALDNYDERDRSTYLRTAMAADTIYQTGLNMDTDWENVRSDAVKAFKGVDEKLLQDMYTAGRMDRMISESDTIGRSVKIGEKLSEMGEQNNVRGQVVVETAVPPKGTMIRTFSEIANNLNVEIHLVDDIVDKDGKVLKGANGTYKNGVIYLNVTNGVESNVGYIFMHEVTHHIKEYAPEQYKELENLVRDRWFRFNPDQMQDEIGKTIDLYKRVANQTLTEEEALEEIIADACHEFINDPDFAREVADENPGLAKAMLNSIKSALRMLRQVLATGSIEQTHMKSLFSYLDILDEAERLWLNAYTEAARNKAAVGLIEWQDKANKGTRHSIPSYTQEEMDAHRQVLIDEATEYYGTPYTARYAEAGYLFPDGKMLKMGIDQRSEDHRMASHAYDDFDGSSTDAMIQFMNEGNIRMSPESFGLDLGTSIEPTSEQYASIRQYVNKFRSSDSPILEFTDANGNTVDSKEYRFADGDEVVNDIKRFYRDGEIGGSQLSQFRYSLSDSDMTVEDGNARWTNERIDSLISEYGASDERYSKAYAVMMNPRDFLKLTLPDERLEQWNEGANQEEHPEVFSLDDERLQRERQTPFLTINSSDSASGVVHSINGHEGRHRMRALMEAGIESVPVALIDYDTKYSKEHTDWYILVSQDFGDGHINNKADVEVQDLVPIKESNRDELIQKFGGEAQVRFSLSEDMEQGEVREFKSGDEDVRFSIREEAPPTKTEIGYKVFFVKDGKLYPPMVANPGGADTPIGVWLNADEGTRTADSKTGRPQVKAGGKGTQGSSGSLAYRPGWHLGTVPVAHQFDRLNPETGKKELFPAQFVWAECEIAADVDYQEEAMSYGYTESGKFRHSYAGLPRLPKDGFYRYRTNPDPKTEEWMITGAMKVNRLLSDEEVNQILEAQGREPVMRQGGNKTLEDLGLTQVNADRRYSINDLNEVGVDITESGSAVRYSLYSWQDTDIDALKAKLREAGFSNARINKWVKDVNSIAALIAGDMTRLNYTADQFQDALKPNSEYYYTLDLSTLCQKRRLYQGTYNKIMRYLVNSVLMPEDTVRLRAMMDEMGYEVPCGICYEESRKKNEGKFAERWLNGYGKKWKGYKNQEHEDPYIPTLYEVTTTEGREKLRAEHPETYESYVNYQKTRGSANPKISYTHTDYRGDILRMTDTDIAKVKHIGGLRIQSFSDFEIPHVIDMMQAVMDMSARNLTAQAYTKVPAFAKIFGGTGIKINLSLIQKVDAEGNPVYEEYVDENGETKRRLVFDAKEGINPDEAFALRDKYSQNVGTILVGTGNQQILDAWADPRVDMVIPFHRSGWSKKEFEKLGLIGYKDFTKGQTERYMMGKKDMALSTASKALGLSKDEKLQPIYSADYWDDSLSGKENAERYLALCAEKHYRPVFYQFLHDNGDGTWSLQEDGSTDGYWKSLIDFKMYDNDGAFAPQEEVQPVFDMEEAQKIMGEYEGGADTLPVADDVVEAFLKEYKENHPKAKFEIPDDARLSISMDLDEPYMDAVNYGNMEEAQRLVDEAAKRAGYNTRAYHGTSSYGFTEFSLTDSEGEMIPSAHGKVFGEGFYFTSIKEATARYSGQRYTIDEESGESVKVGTPGVYDVFLDLGNTLEIDWNEMRKRFTSQKDFERFLRNESEDKDSITIKNIQDGSSVESTVYVIGPNAKTGRSWISWLNDTTNRIKSADTITYADNGSIIPLSERFDPENNDIRYSLPTQDSDGNILTDGQMEYFKNSQARDEQGRLVPVYHVTRTAGFTIFDPTRAFDETSISFTNDLDFALNYSSEDESIEDWRTAYENRYGMEEVESDLDNEVIGHYKVYLNMTNPLILEGDYLDEMDIYEWPVYAKANGYDGVIYRDFEEDGSDIYQVFASNQIKDTRNENPSENPDIRYSFTPEDDALDWLASQYELDDVPLEDEQAEEGRVRMAKSKQDFVNSINAKWNEKWLTEGKVLDNSAKTHIRNVVMAAMANSDTSRKYKAEIVDKTFIAAKSAYWLLKEGHVTEAGEVLYDASVNMVENLDFIEDSQFAMYKNLREYLRTTSFKLGEEYWSDVDYNAFRRKNFGRIKLVKGETNIDSLYQELQEKWPEWFSEDETMTPPDMLLQIDHVLDAIQPYRIAYSSEEMDGLVGDILNDLWNIVYEGKEYKSVADTIKERYDRKTKAMKERHREALRKATEIARDKQYRKDQAKFKEYKEKKKNAKEKAKHFGSIQSNIDWLTDRLLNETKDKNIPEGFRKSLAHLLVQFDMQTERSKKLEAKYGPAQKTLRIRELKDRLDKIAKEDDSGEFRYDGYLFYLMDALAEKVEGKTIDSLDTEDLIVIDTMLKSIRHNFANYNKVRIQEEQVAIANIGDTAIKQMDERIAKYGKRKTYKGVRGLFDKLVNESEETPIYFFERLDPTGNGIGAMYKELRRGEDKHIRNMNFLRNRFRQMFSEYSNNGKPGSELESWRDDSQAKTFNLTNGCITLTPAQIMSLYCLSKRTQAMGHILGAGIVASPVTAGQKLADQFKGETQQVESVVITYPELQDIITSLTPEQIKLADEMQSLLNNEMAAWGNETSLEMYGIKLFREQDYFPIKSSSEVLAKTADSFDVQEKIKNFGFTKPLVRNANNAIMIDDIFSVVADHCNKMSLYNAMAIPISDFMRVYNYKQNNVDGSVKTVQQAIGEAFTRKANDYIMKFIGDVNGNTKTRSDAVNDLMNKALANYKKASIGLNARVALQQPTAIFRSLMVMNAKYFAGVKPSKEALQEMFDHCPISLWKSWGHYDMDMGRDVEDIMMNNDWSRWDAVSMGVYGALDNMTWSMIWQAVKNEVKDKHPDVKVGSPEFFELCNERASEVFDKTQVVDSIFHRSDTMRSKNTLTKMATSFMAEPTLTYNVFRDSLVKARELEKDGKVKEAWQLRGKMVSVLALNAAAVSASAAIWDAVREKGADDDDDKEFGDLWLENFFQNFADNINIINNIYFVKDIYSLKDGWGTSNMALEGFETFFKGWTQLKKKLTEGSDKSWYDIYMNLLGGLGYITGVPVKTFMRDAKAILSKFGMDVFADDGSDNTDDKKTNSLVDSIFLKMGYKKKDSDGESSGKSSESSDKEKSKEEKKAESKAVKKLLKTGMKQGEKAIPKTEQQLLSEIEEKTIGYYGADRDKKIWNIVGDGYTNYIEKGDYNQINKLRNVIEKAGGNVQDFDNKVMKESKSAYKKTMVDDPTDEQIMQQQNIRNYLLEHGMSEEEISAEICYKSDTARDLKAAFRMGNEDYIVDELVTLLRAGITRDDIYKLYKYRNYGAKDYDGKYTQPEYRTSSGTYIWPTQGTITSGYGYRGDDPTLPAGASTYHEGIDIGAPQGTPVIACDGGVVVEAGANGGYGNSVGIRHDDGTISYYNHLYTWGVKVGDKVSQGQQIGQVGSTGTSSGPHLDFRLYKDGEYLDPTQYLQG